MNNCNCATFVLVRNLRDIGYEGMILGLVDMVSVAGPEIFINNGADAALTKPLKREEFKATLKGVCCA